MARLTRYTSFKKLKTVDEPNKITAPEQQHLVQFEALLTRLRSEFTAQKQAKNGHGK